MFYFIVHTLMGMGAFGMVIGLGRAGFESDRLEDFKGLSERSPWMALLMLIFGLAGVPPFVGFWAKWFVKRGLGRGIRVAGGDPPWCFRLSASTATCAS